MRFLKKILYGLFMWPVAMIIWVFGLWEQHPLQNRWLRFSLWLEDRLPTTAADFIAWGEGDLRNMSYDSAVADFTEAIRLDPQSALAYLGRGKSYLGKAAYLRQMPSDLALADLNEAIRLDPTLADAYYARAVATRAESPDQALADLGHALRLNPDHLDAYVMRAQLYVRRGDNQQAVADFTEAVRLDPSQPARYRMRAAAYRALGDDAHAASDEQKVKEIFASLRTAAHAWQGT